MSMGPVEAMIVSGPFGFIREFLEKESAAELRSMRFASRRWKESESAAIISGCDGALRLVERLNKLIEHQIRAERAASAPVAVKEVRRA